VTVPTLGIAGSLDPALEWLQKLQKMRPVKLVVIDGATHSGAKAAIGQPQFLAAVREFITSARRPVLFALSAVIGSTRAARIAGSRPASMSSPRAPCREEKGWRIQRRDAEQFRRGGRGDDRGKSAAPKAARRIASRTTSQERSRRCPEARRRAISRR
jgi:hypothetical protein